MTFRILKRAFVNETVTLISLVFLCLGWNAPIAQAFEALPEFRALQPNDHLDFADPNQVTPEYTSDYLTFLKPLEWEYAWLAHDQGLDLSIGSLSSKHFFIDNRIKLRKRLLSTFEFRFSYLSQRDFEVDNEHHILELIYWLKPEWGLSIYGEASLYKAEDDIGVAALWQPNEEYELRLYHTWPDFSRNERNTEPDVFQAAPKSYGLRSTWHSPLTSHQKELIDFALRIETPVEWLFPRQASLYQAQSRMIQLELRKALTPTQVLELRFQCDKEWEQKIPTTSSSSVTNESWERKRCLNQAFWIFDWRGHQLRPGLSFIYREWNKNADQTVIFRHLSPILWWQLPGQGPEQFQRRWSLGWESTFHEGPSPSPLLTKPWDQHFSEHRLNLRYDMKFSDQATLSLLFTADLDRFGTGETWEGGNAQFQVFF